MKAFKEKRLLLAELYCKADSFSEKPSQIFILNVKEFGMKKLRTTHPILFCILCAAVSAALLYVGSAIYVLLLASGTIPLKAVEGKGMWYAMIAADLAIIIFTLIVMRVCGMLYLLKKKTAGILRCILIALPLIIFDLSAFYLQYSLYSNEADYVVPALSRTITFVVSNVLIGAAEELLCRGLLSTTLLSYFGTGREGILKAALLSSILFGCIHFTNYTGGDPTGVIMQVIYTFGTGVLLCAIYFRSGSIWFLILIHAFEDIYGGLSELMTYGGGSAEITTNVINNYNLMLLVPAIPSFIFGLFLLRKSKTEEIQEMWTDLAN